MITEHNRNELLQSISLLFGREMSARTIIFHQSIANLAGVSVTDLKCLDYIQRGKEATAGDLARQTGLTTGAITAAIDRLEKAGLARRRRSTTDRRKVLLKVRNSPAMARIAPIYEALAHDMARLTGRYSAVELETIRDFSLHCIEILRRRTEAVRRLAKE